MTNSEQPRKRSRCTDDGVTLGMALAGNTVPCAQCPTLIPAARAALPITHGLCARCNVPNLASSRAADAPMYETDAWSRGIKL